ncbi:hypothetical protein ABPG73_007634 [Tetrahymena malaccensis]
MYTIEENEEFGDENSQNLHNSAQKRQYTFTFNNESKDLSSYQGGSSLFNMSQELKYSAPSVLNNQEKEEKLEKIRQMESRMKQLQQEKMQIDLSVNETVERTQLVQENNDLKNQIYAMELQIKQYQQYQQQDLSDASLSLEKQKQIEFEKKVNQLVKENANLIEQFNIAKQDLELLVKQKEVDRAHIQMLEEKLLTFERMNEKLEEKNIQLRDEMIKIQYHSNSDENYVQDLKNQYKRVNDLLDLELKNKKVYEMQLIQAKQSSQSLKQLELEYSSLQQNLEKIKKLNQELTIENNTIKQQYYSENQKNIILEKNSLKIYQLQKELDISQSNTQDVQMQLAQAQKQIQEKEFQIRDLTSSVQELKNQCELKMLEEKQMKEQIMKESEIKVDSQQKVFQLEQHKSEKEQQIRELKRDMEQLKEDLQDQKEKFIQEQQKNKDLKNREYSLTKDIQKIEEQLQNLQNDHDKLQEKYARAQKLSQKEIEESQMIIDEIKSQTEGEILQLTKKCQKLESINEDQEQNLKIVKSELEEYRKKHGNTKLKYEEEFVKVNQLQRKLDEREDTIKQQKEQIETHKLKEQKLTEQLGKIQEQTKIISQEKENQLREMIKVSDMKVKLAERQMEQKENEMKLLREEMAYLSEQLDQGSEVMKEYDRQCIEIEMLTQQKDQLQQTILILEKQVDEKNLEFMQFQQAYRDIEIDREKLQETVIQQESVIQEAKQTENHIREEKRKVIEQYKQVSYEKRISDEKALVTEVVEKQNEELIQKLDNTRNEMKQILEQLRQEKLQVEKLTEENEKLNQRIKELEESQSVMRAIQSEKEKEESRLEVEMLKMKHESMMSLNKQYEEEILQLSKDIQELEKSLKNSNKRINSLQQEIEEKEQQITDLRKELDLVDKQVILKINHEKSQYQTQVTDLQLEVEQMRNLQQQITLLKSNDAKYIETIASLQKEINKLEIDNQDLQFKIKQQDLQLQKTEIAFNQNIHFQASQHVIDLETQIHQLQARNQILDQQLKSMTEKYDQKAKLFERYGVNFDPQHPNYNQTVKKMPQHTNMLTSPPFSPRKNQVTTNSSNSNNNPLFLSPPQKIQTQNPLFNQQAIPNNSQQTQNLLSSPSSQNKEQFNFSSRQNQPLFPQLNSQQYGVNYQQRYQQQAPYQINPMFVDRNQNQLFQTIPNNQDLIDQQILQRCNELTKLY